MLERNILIIDDNKRVTSIHVPAYAREINTLRMASEKWRQYSFNLIHVMSMKEALEYLTDTKSALSDLEICNGVESCPDSKGFLSGQYGNSRTKYQRYCRNGARKGELPNSHRLAKHKEATQQRFTELLALDIRDQNISHILKCEYSIKKNCFSVFNANQPAPTLTSNPDDHIHYSEPRILTVREYARIQSFPDWYVFKGKYTTGGKMRKNEVPRYTQIGNAIPPLVAEQIGIALKDLLNET